MVKFKMGGEVVGVGAKAVRGIIMAGESLWLGKIHSQAFCARYFLIARGRVRSCKRAIFGQATTVTGSTSIRTSCVRNFGGNSVDG